MRKVVAIITLICFLVTGLGSPAALAQGVLLPEPGKMVALSPSFKPAYLWGMFVHSNDLFKFDFLIQRGDAGLTDAQKHEEYTKLIKYFLAALAIPDTDQWVNLSPYEKDRIIPDSFGLTEMGRDLLAQDYLLKQLASSLTDPNSGLGKKFWDGVYAEAYKRFGTTDVLTETFNKVWILPDKAIIFERNNTVHVLESHLKVMTEVDYLAISKNAISTNPGVKNKASQENHVTANPVQDVTQQVMREVIIPAIEREVNTGKGFAQLRQIYSGMILATWYKRTLKESILGKLYADQGKVRGIDQDPRMNQIIYDQYVQAFKKGVFNMIKEDVDHYTQEVIPRRYFSGGMRGCGDMKFTVASPVEDASAAQRVKSEIDVAAVDFKPVGPKALFSVASNGNEIVVRGRDGMLVQGLYRSAIKEMFRMTVAEYARVTHQHRWIDQALFAGELIATPQTFELGRAMLEDSYQHGLFLGIGVDADGKPDDWRFNVVYAVIDQMSSHPDLRRRAFELIADPGTYGLKSNEYDNKTPADEYVQRSPIASITGSISSPRSDDSFVKRMVMGVFGLVREGSDWPGPAKFQLHLKSVKAVTADPKVLRQMNTLVEVLLRNVGNRDPELRDKLVHFRVGLGLREQNAAKQQESDYSVPGEVIYLSRQDVQFTRLIQLAYSASSVEEQGDALMIIVRKYLEAGQSQEAYDLFKKIKRISGVVYGDVLVDLGIFAGSMTLVMNHLEEITSPDKLVYHQERVAAGLVERGKKNEARDFYRKVLRNLPVDKRSRISYLLDLVKGERLTGMKFDETSSESVLDISYNQVKTELQMSEGSYAGTGVDDFLLRCAESVVFELAVMGRYSDAEELVALVDAHFVKVYGPERRRNIWRAEWKRKAYIQIAMAAKERKDLDKFEHYLSLTGSSRQSVLFRIAQNFMQEGNHEGALAIYARIADSAVGKNNVASNLGKAYFEVGKIILEKKGDIQAVARAFVMSAEHGGLDRFMLETIVQMVRKNQGLVSFFPEIIKNAVKSGPVRDYEWYRVILSALREFFPQEVSVSEQEVDEMFAQAELTSFKPFKDQGKASKADLERAKGGIDFAQSYLDMQIKRDGAGVLLPMSQQNLDNIHINGLEPVILDIRPAASVSTLMQ
ncbi:MAG: hypothetical protein HQL22_07060 [Candidatus Omnitrophica bacterium]|nr:hypothetical protein [Candidatus Omnitrophota bacterium]